VQGRTAQVVTVLAIGVASVVLTGGGAHAATRSRPSTVAVLDAHAAVSSAHVPPRFVPVRRTAKVVAGGSVQTDATGFAEVHYPDGSLARLGTNTTFTIVAANTTTTKTKFVSGEVWNEVKKSSGSTTHYDVATPNATAAVRGTAFGVVCSNQHGCTFGVVNGTVVVTAAAGGAVTITAGEQVEVSPTGTLGQPAPLVLTPWIEQNQYQDVAEHRQVPGTLDAASTVKVSSTTPQTIARAIAAANTTSVAAANDAAVAYSSVVCTGTKALAAGQVTSCTATGPANSTVTYRAVVIGKGKVGVTRRQRLLDVRAVEALGVSKIALAGPGAGPITAVSCGGPDTIVVDVPSSALTCTVTDSQGGTGPVVISIGADGHVIFGAATVTPAPVPPVVESPAPEPVPTPPAETTPSPPPSDGGGGGGPIVVS
jgi:hypothetical protein